MSTISQVDAQHDLYLSVCSDRLVKLLFFEWDIRQPGIALVKPVWKPSELERFGHIQRISKPSATGQGVRTFKCSF